MRKKKIYFITENHNSFVGIKDYLYISQEIFKDYDVVTKKEIQKNSINILVENFTKKKADKIIKFKKKYNSKIILILTEFINNNANIYNSFELKNKIHRYIPYAHLSFLNLLLLFSITYTLSVIFFFDFKISNFYALFVVLTYLLGPTFYYVSKQYIKKILIKYTSFNLIKYRKFKKKFFFKRKKKKKGFNIRNMNFFVKLFKFKYFKIRYEQSKRIIMISDMILVSHPLIYRNVRNLHKKIYYALPEIKKIEFNIVKDYRKMFKFSGELTDYRYSFFEDLKKYFLLTDDKIKDAFKYFINKIKNKNTQFIDINSKHKYRFSFHPKKIDDWIYSSPVRYISAIKKGEIPIIFDNFKDSISDDLTISLNKISKKG